MSPWPPQKSNVCLICSLYSTEPKLYTAGLKMISYSEVIFKALNLQCNFLRGGATTGSGLLGFFGRCWYPSLHIAKQPTITALNDHPDCLLLMSRKTIGLCTVASPCARTAVQVTSVSQAVVWDGIIQCNRASLRNRQIVQTEQHQL